MKTPPVPQREKNKSPGGAFLTIFRGEFSALLGNETQNVQDLSLEYIDQTITSLIVLLPTRGFCIPFFPFLSLTHD